jgi:hypothetical protein
MIQIDPICGMRVDTEKAQFKAEIRVESITSAMRSISAAFWGA